MGGSRSEDGKAGVRMGEAKVRMRKGRSEDGEDGKGRGKDGRAGVRMGRQR